MAKKSGMGVDPTWPHSEDGDHPVTELNSDRQGALSPVRRHRVPAAERTLPYKHPTTVINTNPDRHLTVAGRLVSGGGRRPPVRRTEGAGPHRRGALGGPRSGRAADAAGVDPVLVVVGAAADEVVTAAAGRT